MAFDSWSVVLTALSARALHLSELHLAGVLQLLTNKIETHELLSHPKRLHVYLYPLSMQCYTSFGPDYGVSIHDRTHRSSPNVCAYPPQNSLSEYRLL